VLKLRVTIAKWHASKVIKKKKKRMKEKQKSVKAPHKTKRKE
jgi:hypothetical protein